MLIGFVDIMHNGNLVFHQNLTQRTLEDVKDLSAENIQALAQTEADEIVASECCLKCCEDYITLCNLGLYGEE
jgi:hypothetical protein